MRSWLVISFLVCFLSWPAFSQTTSKRCQWLKLTDKPVLLDSLTVVPGSITFSKGKYPGLGFIYNPGTSLFSFTNVPVPQPIRIFLDSLSAPDSLQMQPADTVNTNGVPADSVISPKVVILPGEPDSVLVCYRVLPLNLALARYKRKLTAADTVRLPGVYYTESLGQKEELFSTPGLNKTGTVTRGITFGNKQNVFVNSALNLQLEGKLSDEIDILAAITDQNIPFQPEGNTQQLQEFDKVYITLRHRLWNITGGDVVLKNKPSHFLRFYKNVQGGVLEVNRKQGTKNASSTTIAASVAKGKFASVAITPQEGVQGPYRVPGPNNEKFIIILANSERVFLDGQLLTRGFDFDYVIDYNQAEITFTTRRLITRYSRIRVDFEYSERNYNRSVYHASHYQDLNKLHLNFNIYNEGDNQNNLLTLNLNNQEKLLLQSIGDSLNQAFTPGAELANFDPELILYKDSTILVNGQPDNIYVYTREPDLNRYYTVRFTDVGPMRGDYVPAGSTVNGRTFRYVPPVNGVRQGSYAPVRILPTPQKKQLATVGGNYQIDDQTNIFFETAASEYDVNKFSEQDSRDDKGKAMRVGYAIEDKPVALLGNYKLRSALSYEYTDANFQPIDRFRDIEFNRNWSLPINADTRVNDNIFNFSVGAQKDVNNLVNYRLIQRYRQNEVEGMQHYLDFARQFRGINLRSDFFLLDATARTGQSDWSRGNIDVNYPAYKIIPGYTYRFDKNRVNAISRPDSVLQSAMYFDEHTFYIRSQDTAATKFSLDYAYRQDRRPEEGRLGPRNTAHTYRGMLQTKIGSSQDLNVLLTYRQVDNKDSLNESAILSTVNWLGDFLDRHLRSELSYTVATGQEARRRYEFVQVGPGQGTHYLIEGGNPQELNDYFEAQVPDARYRTHIKVFLPTDEYIRAYSNQFNYRLNSAMPRSWRGKSAIQNFASRLSAVTYININKKTTDDDVWHRFNPFSLNIEDRLLVSLANTFRNTVFYNRSDPTFGLEYTLQQNQQKILLTNGTDVRNIGTQTIIARYNLNKTVSAKFNISQFTRESLSNYLSTKNFRIVGYDVSPEFSYQPTNATRFTGTYLYTRKQNRLNQSETQEKGIFHELGLETRVSQVSKRTLTGTLKYINVNYQGNENSAIGYEMLNALRPGDNLTWNFILQQRLANGLNISVNYDGRKPNGQEILHTGRMQVSLLF
ncbi:hypothetical protein AAE02nite_29210 [Adhaeribacter aerolatus]|uniref:Cell surface protein SprA n=1 Tax=Adhaeribacter aerolatus TaxID=670289 RepID=A0A512B0D8_9BACT|nr:hypothetical protein [Adhaeribacter aerolatus]GEO05257.1 hypothetical protein AAE02nite_29210 [Adhaeribacter aerolatus]